MLMLMLQDGAPGGQLTSFIVMVVLLFGIMWFLVIRPQRKRDRERREMLEALRKNDRILTVGGIHGTVRAIRGDEVTLLVDESTNTKLRVSRSAIAQIVSETKEEGELSESTDKE